MSTTTAQDVIEIRNRLHANAERFVQYDYVSNSVVVHFDALATLVAEIVAARMAALRVEAHAQVAELEAERDQASRLCRQAQDYALHALADRVLSDRDRESGSNLPPQQKVR